MSLASGELALFGGAPVVRRRGDSGGPSPEGGPAHRLWPIVTDDERQAVMRVLDRGILSGPFAPEATALEEEFARFVGARHCLLSHCGTSALAMALGAAGVKAGDEVLVPAYSFVATPLSVLQIGAIPVFVDVDDSANGTGCIDPGALAAAITPHTRAVMPVHMHGGAADMTAIVAFARARGLRVIEDAAQAHGTTCDGRPVGAIGDAGGFSLQSSKNLGAGEGGLFVTNDRAMAEEANSIRNFGQNLLLADGRGYDRTRPLDGGRPLDSQRIGSMYRGNEMMAAFARAQLARLPERTARCQKNAERLSLALADLPGVTPPRAVPGRTSVHHKYRVQLDPQRAGVELSPEGLRDATAKALSAEGLEVVFWQGAPLPAQPVFQRRDPAMGFPASRPGGADLASNYQPARYPKTRALLDGSIVLFSQSCPLIAQDDDLVDRYIEAFRRVWHHRAALAAWAARQPPTAA
ncbi:MAG TPA: DegT/DnrJ/EryC1/StrS family aminotransferase [Polyangiaceae bacterium]|nr:DegT/DnrJ/EryC1/StrS family aminotransferase [Polyangiaceae bacterium]